MPKYKIAVILEQLTLVYSMSKTCVFAIQYKCGFPDELYGAKGVSMFLTDL